MRGVNLSKVGRLNLLIPIVGAICQSSCCDKCYQQQVKFKHLWPSPPRCSLIHFSLGGTGSSDHTGMHPSFLSPTNWIGVNVSTKTETYVVCFVYWLSGHLEFIYIWKWVNGSSYLYIYFQKHNEEHSQKSIPTFPITQRS